MFSFVNRSIVTIFNQKMETIDAHASTVASILNDSKRIQHELQPYLQQVQRFNIQFTYMLVGEIAKNLSKKVQPIVKVNSLTAACKIVEVANYPALLLLEIYIVPYLQNVINFVIAKPDFKYFTAFFSSEGYNSSIPYLQNLSYNFVCLACQFIQLTSTVKPFKIYQGKEYSDPSNFKKEVERIKKSGYRVENVDNRFQLQDQKILRDRYLCSLSQWSQMEQNMLIFFINSFEALLNEGREPRKHSLSYLDVLKYGEPSVCSELIARSIEMVGHSENFELRLRALRLLDSFILWGDIEALLVINYSENIQHVVHNLWIVDGNRSIQAGRKIYPDIEGQEDKKYQFYVYFLRCIQNWSECYPTNTFSGEDNNQNQEHTAVYRLYRLLKDKKRFIFPTNLGISKYQKQTHQNMRQKMIRNQLILNQVNAQDEPNREKIQMVKTKNLREVKRFYNEHQEYLLGVLHRGENELDENMNMLSHFKEWFQRYIEAIDARDEEEAAIDQLIENGLELIDLINGLQMPYVLFLKHQYTYHEFKDIATDICYEYFNPKTKEAPLFKPTLSEKQKNKKSELLFLIKSQKSFPLWNQLQQIFNEVDIKQLREKYKQKKGKHHNVWSEESASSISLELFTKTKFSRQSREERLKCQLATNSMKDISLEQLKNQSATVKSNVPPLLKQSRSSNKSKKLIVVTSLEKKKSLQSSTATNQKQQIGSPGLIKVKSSKGSTKSNQTSSTPPMPPMPPKALSRPSFPPLSPSNQCILVPFEQNAHYFHHLNRQQFKYSYVYAHIVIYSSPFLTVERIVSQINESNQVKVKVELVLIPKQPIQKVFYEFVNQQCIDIQDRSIALPQTMLPNVRYRLQLVATMKKIPLNLPIFKMTINNQPIFQYLLPFTINFFLPSCPNQTQVLQNYNSLVRNNYKCFYSRGFGLNETLFPNKNLNKITAYFPNLVKMDSQNRVIYLWQVKDKNSNFFVAFQYDFCQEELTVKIFCTSTYDISYHSIFSFILNCLVHILAHNKTFS